MRSIVAIVFALSFTACAPEHAPCGDYDLGADLGKPVLDATLFPEDVVTAGWVAPFSGTFTFATDGSSFDTVLRVTRECGDGTKYTNDNGPGTETSELEIEVVRGEQMMLTMLGYTALEGGDLILNIEDRPFGR
ncbi:MAG: hypothetical protein EP330_22370 [Deltaproteobacteria bacterium]|nr:MAG: hypothetical protein EP330_22370 [Deltaproteobacteria bacterium]